MLAYIENELEKYKNLSNLNFSQDNEELLEYISQLFDLLSKNNHDIELKNLVKIQNNLTKVISKQEVKKSMKRKKKSVCKCFGAKPNLNFNSNYRFIFNFNVLYTNQGLKKG